MTTLTVPATRAARGAALAAGPSAVVSLALTAAAIARGGDNAAIARSPLGIAAAVVGLISLIALAVALVDLLRRTDRFTTGAGRPAWLLAFAGTIMTAGGQWDAVFLVPGLAAKAPQIADTGLDTVTVGYLLSFALLALGWVAVAAVLVRARVRTAWLLAVGAVLCLGPLPVRWFVLAIAVSLVGGRSR
ncbi:hypothetical protein [Microbispora sp. GKU 823]|uniref:hypothetical protein n=1 Tax=Microbispora sp. GKU 823 TaxID=1652100 RepID=UPI0009A2B21E|nr:hypothetical protein [Microbispora sp. GKU 823]OPG14784.1 hypothetical protein B1L11_01230 [Microbispora sp. GKU 823]